MKKLLTMALVVLALLMIPVLSLAHECAGGDVVYGYNKNTYAGGAAAYYVGVSTKANLTCAFSSVYQDDYSNITWESDNASVVGFGGITNRATYSTAALRLVGHGTARVTCTVRTGFISWSKVNFLVVVNEKPVAPSTISWIRLTEQAGITNTPITSSTSADFRSSVEATLSAGTYVRVVESVRNYVGKTWYRVVYNKDGRYLGGWLYGGHGTVLRQPTSFTISENPVEIDMNNTTSRTVTLSATGGDGVPITWGCRYRSLVDLSQNKNFGNITVSGNKATITVTDEGVTNLEMTAYDPHGGLIALVKLPVHAYHGTSEPGGVGLNAYNVSLKVGSSFNLVATVTPSNAVDKSVTWSSSNTAVAKVTNGTVVGVSKGTAVITARTNRGGYTASATVTVSTAADVCNCSTAYAGTYSVAVASLATHNAHNFESSSAYSLTLSSGTQVQVTKASGKGPGTYAHVIYGGNEYIVAMNCLKAVTAPPSDAWPCGCSPSYCGLYKVNLSSSNSLSMNSEHNFNSKIAPDAQIPGGKIITVFAADGTGSGKHAHTWYNYTGYGPTECIVAMNLLTKVSTQYSYTLQLNANGGSISGPTSYTVSVASRNNNNISATQVTRPGYRFEGWYYGSNKVYDENGYRNADCEAWHNGVWCWYPPNNWTTDTMPLTARWTDVEVPTMSNLRITEVTRDSFTVACTVTDNNYVSSVCFHVWTTENGQDDERTYYASRVSDNEWVCTVDVTKHGGSNTWYSVSAEAFDGYDNRATLENSNAAAYPDTLAPVISNLRVTDVTPEGYNVSCTVTDNYQLDHISFPTWVVAGLEGEADIVWYPGEVNGTTATAHISIGNHNNKQDQVYHTEVRAWDTLGNVNEITEASRIETYVDATAPVISNVTVTECSASGYRVSCVVDDASGISRVQFPTWTDNNGQDDLIWHDGTFDGNAWTYYISTAEHNYEADCVYTTHIYAYDVQGNYSTDGVQVYVDATAPEISGMHLENLSSTAFRVSCAVTDDANAVERVQFTVTCDGDDDGAMLWFEGVREGDNWVCTVDVPVDFAGQVNRWYFVSATAWDTWGNMSTGGSAHTFVYDLSNMSTLRLPGSVQVIGSEAFVGTDAQVIVIPTGCAEIAADAFNNCPNLQYILNYSGLDVDVPENVTVITPVGR